MCRWLPRRRVCAHAFNICVLEFLFYFHNLYFEFCFSCSLCLVIQLSLFTSYSYSLLVDCVRRDTRHVNSASKECQQTLVAADLLQPKIALICSAVSIMRSWWMPHKSAPSNTWSSAQRGSWTRPVFIASSNYLFYFHNLYF